MINNNYSHYLEKDMRTFYESLSEKDKRRYAAVESKKLGHGGITYVSLLFCCDEKTIRKGIHELASKDSMEQLTIRRSGGGRKPTITKYTNNKFNIDEVFLAIIQKHTAGDPMNDKIKWTNLTRSEIRDLLRKKKIIVSVNIVRKLLKKHGFVKRKAIKKKLQA